MSAADIVANTNRVLLACVTLWTFIDLMRHRDRARFDIFLMFAALGGIVAIQGVMLVTGVRSVPLGVLAIFLLIAQPYLLLRMVLHFRPVHRFIRWGALGGLVVAGTGLILVRP